MRSSKYSSWFSHKKTPKSVPNKTQRQWQTQDLLLTLHFLKPYFYFVVCTPTSTDTQGHSAHTWGALGNPGVSAWRSPQGFQGSVKMCWLNRATLPYVGCIRDSQNQRVFWVERDPQGSLRPTLKWMAHTGNREGISELRTAEMPLCLCSILKARLGTHQQLSPWCFSSSVAEICIVLWCSAVHIRDPWSNLHESMVLCKTMRNPSVVSEQNVFSLQQH